MAILIAVRPLRAGLTLEHPLYPGVLPAEGGNWPADQFTFRRIQDGEIELVPAVPAAPPAPKASAPAAPPSTKDSA